jgi:hypothetical protein
MSEPEDKADGNAAADLNPSQAHALFNILTHANTYYEIEKFKYAETISTSGHPFTSPDSSSTGSSVPVLNYLFRKWILTCPGFTDLPETFWTAKIQPLLVKLGAADLSEAYDKGSLGMRKTLATAEASVLEGLVRGVLGGYAPRSVPEQVGLKAGRYDLNQASDLARAWDDCLQSVVHGDFMDEIIDHLATTEDIESHSPAVHAAIEYMLLHIATFLHHVVVLTPEGKTLVQFVANTHRLVPYTVVRQTLYMANAATMLAAMTRLVLAKIPLINGGMNLMQRIVSTVLSWDAAEFRKTVERVESGKGDEALGKEYQAALKEYLAMSREQHETIRIISLEKNISIVVAVLEASSSPSLAQDLTPQTHALCLEYLAAQLSVRDREELTTVFCRSTPDLFTDGVRDLVSAFDPMIRAVHAKVSLSDPLTGAEKFLDDFIKLCKGDNVDTQPSVEDYVLLLRRHRHVLYKFWHAVIGQCPEVIAPFRSWLRDALALFRRGTAGGEADKEEANGAAGAATAGLNKLFRTLPEDQQKQISSALDKHARYLASLDKANTARMQAILDNLAAAPEPKLPGKQTSKSATPASTAPPSASTSKEQLQLKPEQRSMRGPGQYLARWQALMDDTTLTSATAEGKPRHGFDIRGEGVTGRQGDADAGSADAAAARHEDDDLPSPPDMSAVLDLLGPKFEAMLAASKELS